MLDQKHLIRSTSRFVERHAESLRSLLGTTLQASWIAWDRDDDAWWPDEAVVLRIGGRQLEVVCYELDQVALTWGEIDTCRAPRHVCDWGDARLEWRENGHAVLAKAIGGVLRNVGVLECRLRTRVEGEWREAWLLGGIELGFSSGIVRVVNALDENGLESEPGVGPDVRRIPL